MPITKEKVLELIDVYKKAWETQNADLILTIFETDASYFDPFYEEPVHGHEGIYAYWSSKVCKEQRDISFKLLNLWVDGSQAICEWEAEFDDLVKKERKMIREVAIFDLSETKFANLREYYKSKVLRKL